MKFSKLLTNKAREHFVERHSDELPYCGEIAQFLIEQSKQQGAVALWKHLGSVDVQPIYSYDLLCRNSVLEQSYQHLYIAGRFEKFEFKRFAEYNVQPFVLVGFAFTGKTRIRYFWE
jgi:hypothetical protein